MPLTDAKLRAAKPAQRPYKMADAAGLFVLVTPAGGKLWRFKFRRAGKEKLLSLGAYPQLPLSEARRRRDEALNALSAGRDPAAEKQARKRETVQAAQRTFESVAREWHASRLHDWTPKYGALVLRRLEADVFPLIGDRAIAEIDPKTMLTALRETEARGVFETTQRLKQYASAVFRYAIACGECAHDPSAPLKGALKPPPRPVHHKALPRAEIGPFLVKLDHYDGDARTRLALRLALLTVVRTGELRAARWEEFEQLDQPDAALWRIPAERMKMKTPHLVPLSRQAVAALQELHGLSGQRKALFPSVSAQGVMSNNTMLYALYRLGYHGRTTTHGFRRMFSTEANERGFHPDWIERQLAHDERDQVRGAYNAAQYLPQRREMLQWWADDLDGLRAGAA